MANTIFDGSNFVGIDDDAWGDGSGNTRPEDTVLENLVDNNARHLWALGHRWSWARLQGTENQRRLTSYAWAVHDRAVCTVHPTMTKLTAILDGTITRRVDGANAAIDVRLEVVKPDGQTVYEGRVDNLGTGGTSLPYAIDATLVGDRPQREQLCTVKLWLRGQPKIGDPANDVIIGPSDWSGLSISSQAGLAQRWYRWAVDSAQASQVGEDLVMFVTTGGSPPSNVLTSQAYEPIYGYVDGTDYNVVWNEVAEPEDPQKIGTGGNAAYALSYVDLESIIYQKHFDETLSDRAWAPKSAASMRPNRSILGPHVAHHADNTDAVHARSRPKIWGIRGDTPTLSAGDTFNAWSTRSTRWAIVDSSDAKSGYVEWQRRGLRLDIGEQSYVDLHLQIVPVYLEDSDHPSFAAVTNRTIGGTWNIRATIDQIDGAGWSNTVQFAQEVIQLERPDGDHWPHWPSTYRDHTPFLQQAYFSYFEETTDAYTRTYREGVLFEDDTEDGGLVLPQSMRLDLTSEDLQEEPRDEANRLLLEAEFVGGETAADADRFRLYLVGLCAEETSTIDIA